MVVKQGTVRVSSTRESRVQDGCCRPTGMGWAIHERQAGWQPETVPSLPHQHSPSTSALPPQQPIIRPEQTLSLRE